MLPIANVLAAVVTAFSATMLVPLMLALFGSHDAALPAFALATVIGIAGGAITWALTRSFKRELKIRDGILLVALTWTLIPLIASLPLLLHFGSALSFTDAYFEMVSALTTTGATIFTNLDGMPPSINLWRHLVNWFGGMGIIVLAVAILPPLGVGGMQLFKAETPGPMKDSKLTPRIEQTAKALWLVYAAITAACILCLWVAGMSWFDAICHAFSAMSLGGFSTHDASSAAFAKSIPFPASRSATSAADSALIARASWPAYDEEAVCATATVRMVQARATAIRLVCIGHIVGYVTIATLTKAVRS